MSENPQLSPGDFVYQSDQELFLVVVDETDTGYKFAVHGWREISDERLEEYLDHKNGRLHRGDELEELVREQGESETVENFERLRELFAEYNDIELSEDGPEDEFALDDQ